MVLKTLKQDGLLNKGRKSSSFLPSRNEKVSSYDFKKREKVDTTFRIMNTDIVWQLCKEKEMNIQADSLVISISLSHYPPTETFTKLTRDDDGWKKKRNLNPKIRNPRWS